MITAGGKTAQGRRLLILGLADENLRRLRAGQPIKLQRSILDACGLGDVEVAVIYAETVTELEVLLGIELANRGDHVKSN